MKYALYDLGSQPTSFSFLEFAIIVKSECAAVGEDCHLIFKRGPNEGFHEVNTAPYGVEDKKFRLAHILYPICAMLDIDYSTVDNLDMFDIKESELLTHENRMSLRALLEQYKKAPLIFPKPSKKAVEMIEKQFPTKPVVITLRETSGTDRNSNLPEWLKFAKYVSKTNDVVFVRDTRKWNDPLVYKDKETGELGSFCTLPAASIDLDLRLALFRRAKVNFCIGGGSSNLARLSDGIPYRTFKYMRTGPARTRTQTYDITEEQLSDPKVKEKMEEEPYCLVSKSYLLEQIAKGNTKLSLPNNKGGYSLFVFNDPDRKKYKGAGTLESFKSMGFFPGSQFPWADENQKIIWEDDTYENLKEEYNNWRENFDK